MATTVYKCDGRNFVGVGVCAFTGNCKKWFEEKRNQNTRETTKTKGKNNETQWDPHLQSLSLSLSKRPPTSRINK
jgi:coenzyme F420-reducing hydrogenase gamma subunit